MGCVKPGPVTLTDKYVIEFNGDQIEGTRIFKGLISCCMHGYVYGFKERLMAAAALL